jgi:hypothetical protein
LIIRASAAVTIGVGRLTVFSLPASRMLVGRVSDVRCEGSRITALRVQRRAMNGR